MGYIKWSKLKDAKIIIELGKQLKQMRLNRNISQSQLAEDSGIDRVTISKIENGRPASLMSWIQLTRAFDKLHVWEAFEEESFLPAEKVTKKSAAKTKKRVTTLKGKAKGRGKSSRNISFDID